MILFILCGWGLEDVQLVIEYLYKESLSYTMILVSLKNVDITY